TKFSQVLNTQSLLELQAEPEWQSRFPSPVEQSEESAAQLKKFQDWILKNGDAIIYYVNFSECFNFNLSFTFNNRSPY
ncbi:2879_t:CDS:1, partial [Gigaspora margarita]